MTPASCCTASSRASSRSGSRLDRQLDLSYSIPGLARFRVNIYSQRESLAGAFRLIPADLKSLEELGLPPSLYELATSRADSCSSGPTGSGKSTTLASLIDEINRTKAEHIITIEDPIEFLHRHKRCIVNQRELGPTRPRSPTLCAARSARTPT